MFNKIICGLESRFTNFVTRICGSWELVDLFSLEERKIEIVGGQVWFLTNS